MSAQVKNILIERKSKKQSLERHGLNFAPNLENRNWGGGGDGVVDPAEVDPNQDPPFKEQPDPRRLGAPNIKILQILNMGKPCIFKTIQIW